MSFCNGDQYHSLTNISLHDKVTYDLYICATLAGKNDPKQENFCALILNPVEFVHDIQALFNDFLEIEVNDGEELNDKPKIISSAIPILIPIFLVHPVPHHMDIAANCTE